MKELQNELNKLRISEFRDLAKRTKEIFAKYYPVEAYTTNKEKRLLELETKDGNKIEIKFQKIKNEERFEILNWKVYKANQKRNTRSFTL